MTTGLTRFLHIAVLVALCLGTIVSFPGVGFAQDATVEPAATEVTTPEPTEPPVVTESTEPPTTPAPATDVPTTAATEETKEATPAKTKTATVTVTKTAKATKTPTPAPTNKSQPKVAAVTTPKIAISKTKGAVGTSITVTITDFTPSTTVKVQWDGGDLSSSKTNSSGDATVTIQVPAAIAGAHKIAAVITGTTRSANFTVTSKIAVSPSSGTAGQSVTVKLTGYGKSEKVDVLFGSTKVKTVSVASTGGWSGSINVPSGASAGNVTVKGTGTTGNTSSDSFTVTGSATPTATATPVTGSLQVTVVDSSDDPITGACFTVFKSVSGKRGASLATACDNADGANGVTSFGAVPAGTVLVAETSAPAGYLPASDLSVTIVAKLQKSVEVTNEVNDALTILSFDELGAPLPGSCYIVYTDIGGGSLGTLVASACDDDDDANDGVIRFGELKNGNLVLVEKVVPRGYARVARHAFTYNTSTPTAISVQNVPGGAIAVTKVNDIGDPINGACFDAYVDLGGGAMGNFVDRGCNPDGNVVTVSGLNVGNYYLVESKAPVGYKAAANQKFSIQAKKDVAVTVSDEPTTKLIIRKQTEAERPLKGACFDIYKDDGGDRGDRVLKNKCDNDDKKDDGYTTFPLSSGEFILVESKAPKGYLIGDDLAFTIETGLDTDLTVTNVLGGTVRVTTHDETGQWEDPHGACYTVSSVDGAKKTKLGTACDQSDGHNDGVTSISGLPEGTWLLEQTKTPFGYFDGEDFEVDVVIRETTDVEYFNEPWPLLIINKVDENGDPLGGACFTAFVDLGGGQRGSEWKSPDGPLCDDDKDGILYALVTPGNQILVETKSPIGYLPVQDTPFVMIRGDVTELTVENFKVGFIYVTKKSDTGTKLTGACFEAYHDVNGKRGSKAASGCDRETKSGSYNKTLDAVTILNGLEPGDYWLVEKTAPKGYFPAEDILVEVTTAKTEVTVEDEPWPTLTITKVDENGDAVKGACFQLFKVNNDVRGTSASSKVCGKTNNIIKIGAAPGTYILGEVTTPAGFVPGKDVQVTYKRGVDGKITVVNTAAGFVHITNLREGDLPLEGSCWEIWTDASGKPGKRVDRACNTATSKTPGQVTMEGPAGKYWLKQATTPTGYEPSANQKITIVARQTLQITVRNNPYPRFVVNSVDGANKPLPGACFDIYVDGGDKVGKKVVTALCDKADKVNDGTTTRRLAPGRYVAREVTAPADYAKAPDFEFTIVANTDLVLTLQHQLAGIVVVNTQDRASLKLNGACYELWTKLSNGKKGVLVAKACDKDSSDSSSKTDGSTKLKALPPGSYLLVQSFATSGYQKAADKQVTVLGGSTTTVTVINDRTE